MTTTQLITSSNPKGQDAVAKFCAAYNKMGFNPEAAQRLNESGEFWKGLKTLMGQHSVSNQFVSEETQSSYGYLSGYTPNRSQKIELILVDFEKQIKVLDGHFNCGTRFNPDWIVKTHATAPDWVEKFFAQFPWQQIASTYGEAVQKVLDLINQTRNGAFYNYREGQLGPDQLYQLEKSIKFTDRLILEQQIQGVDCDVTATPAQFGLQHRGRSVRRVREVLLDNEFGLGAFAVGIMILTHPERLMNYDDLWIDCAGDEFAPDADGDFSGSLIFCFDGGRLRFCTSGVAHAYGGYGSVSAFFPQS